MSAVSELRNLLEDLERNDTNVIDLVTHGQPPQAWRLYPGESGIFDRQTRCQFYFHSHGVDSEAGHFHTVRLFDDHTAHLVAISMTTDGWPQALLTLNLWAIGDAYETAGKLRRYVRGFHIAERAGPPPLVRFVNLIFQAFAPQIERLQEEKIETLSRYRVAHPDRDIFEDRSVEILSRVEVDMRPTASDVTPMTSCCAKGRKASMTSSPRLMSVALLLTGLLFATSSLAVDFDALMQEFRVAPAGLKPAPAFSLKNIDGKTVALADHRGQPVLLYFWATW
jgi:hypothetical protein